MPFIRIIVHPLGYIAQSCSIWITVLLAINRFVAVCYPFHSEKYLTLRLAKIQVCILFIRFQFQILIFKKKLFSRKSTNIHLIYSITYSYGQCFMENISHEIIIILIIIFIFIFITLTQNNNHNSLFIALTQCHFKTPII